MDKFVRLDGLVAPLDRNNVDTDAIIPKQFLKSIKRSGFGPNAFDEWRYMDVGQPGQDNSGRPKNPNFVLNQPRYQGKVLRMRFGIEMNTDHTLEEVGKQFDVTRERIRQIEAKALRKLRHPSRSERLRSFLDNEA